MMSEAPDDPRLLGPDPSALPDDMLIGIRQWAALEDRARETVRLWRHDAAVRRSQGIERATDMPPEDTKCGNSPRWRMATYRAWKEARGA